MNLILLLSLVAAATANVFVLNAESGKKLKLLIRDLEAGFGPGIPSEGLAGFLVMANPLNACRNIEAAPTSPSEDLVPIVLIQRYGNCNFEQKVKMATKANFSAAIVFNVNSDKLVPMGGEDDEVIPSVFIGQTDANLLIRNYIYSDYPQYTILITGEEPFDINSYLLPFVIVVGILFLVILFLVIFKWCQDHRRSRRHRLPKSALKKIPTIKFKSGDPYETCCICLEDYVEGDKLRILPCDHGYHSKCIDPWLVKSKRICPQCRKKVFETRDSSDTETEDERAPLLTNTNIRVTRTTRGGTFTSTIRRPLLNQRRTVAVIENGQEPGTANERGAGDNSAMMPSTSRTRLFSSSSVDSDDDFPTNPSPAVTALIHSVEVEPQVHVVSRLRRHLPQDIEHNDETMPQASTSQNVERGDEQQNEDSECQVSESHHESV